MRIKPDRKVKNGAVFRRSTNPILPWHSLLHQFRTLQNSFIFNTPGTKNLTLIIAFVHCKASNHSRMLLSSDHQFLNAKAKRFTSFNYLVTYSSPLFPGEPVYFFNLIKSTRLEFEIQISSPPFSIQEIWGVLQSPSRRREKIQTFCAPFFGLIKIFRHYYKVE